MKLNGIHHITAITADAQRNIDFYAGVLGLRLVKKSVNQDEPSVYHLFYADEQGSPGADMTFFETPGGGAVFSTGSITFCGCLPVNGFDNNLSRLLQNVVDRFLDPEARFEVPGN